jgi:hypothetical protein
MQIKTSVWAPNLSSITLSHVGIREGCRTPIIQVVWYNKLQVAKGNIRNQEERQTVVQPVMQASLYNNDLILYRIIAIAVMIDATTFRCYVHLHCPDCWLGRLYRSAQITVAFSETWLPKSRLCSQQSCFVFWRLGFRFSIGRLVSLDFPSRTAIKQGHYKTGKDRFIPHS